MLHLTERKARATHLDFDQAEVAEEDGLDRFAEHDGLKDALIPQDLYACRRRAGQLVEVDGGSTSTQSRLTMVQALLFAR